MKQPATLWPWTAKAALAYTPIALFALLVSYGVVRAAWHWPDAGLQGWVLAAIAAYSVIPLLLLVIQAIASSGGTLRGPGGFSLSFAADSGRAAATVTARTLAENLATPATQAQQATGLPNLLAALADARHTDITIVDLREGNTWWESRLFILVAAAARRRRPSAIAFVTTSGEEPGTFVGWADPQALLEQHLLLEPVFRLAYQAAESATARWELGTPVASTNGQSVDLPWAAPGSAQGARETLPQPSTGPADRTFAFELYLQRECDTKVPADLAKRTVGKSRLEALFDAVLVRDAVRDDATDEQWSTFLTRHPHRFFALTTGNVLKTLVPRDLLVAALVGRLVEAHTRLSEGAVERDEGSSREGSAASAARTTKQQAARTAPKSVAESTTEP